MKTGNRVVLLRRISFLAGDQWKRKVSNKIAQREGKKEKKDTRREGCMVRRGTGGVRKGQMSNSIGQCWYVMCEWWREVLLFCMKKG